MKTEIINELDSLIQLTSDLDNVYIKNRLRYVKKLLITEWNESDLFLEQLEKEVHFNNSTKKHLINKPRLQG